jgi:transglutaminase-like putative cysteine protease
MKRCLAWFTGAVVVLGIALVGRIRPVAADDWQPITPDELKLTSLPEAPGAPAVILYRQVDRDDVRMHEFDYVRIKIFTEEGRTYADVEIPMFKEQEQVNNIRARTISPDGAITNFDRKVYDKVIVKTRGLKYKAKTFTLPNVQAGSIVEYQYTTDWNQSLVYDSRWILSEDLFIKHAKFSLKPSGAFPVQWRWQGLPNGVKPEESSSDHIVRLEVDNLPAFQEEEFAPPENELKARVDFIYNQSEEKDPDKFWNKESKKRFGDLQSFAGKEKVMQQAASQIVAASDSPEVKLQKIYARVQQMRNTSYETAKSEEEKKRESLKDLNNAEEAWKKGYANGVQLTWLFYALARGAGLDAYPVLCAPRNEYFFYPKLMDKSRLTANVVLVKVDGKELYFDPGDRFAPYGLLPWQESEAAGLVLAKDGGRFVQTGWGASADSEIVRKAEMRLTDHGDLEGKLTVTFTGTEAIVRRTDENNEDDAARKKYLEDEAKSYVPAGIDVELTNKPDWNTASVPLVAEYSLKVPGWASGAGHRALLPVGLFSQSEKHLFEHASRVYAVYFPYYYRKIDDVEIQLPLGWKVSSLPAPQNVDAGAAAYQLKVEDAKGELHITRELRSDLGLIPASSYSALRRFFQAVRTGDEEQIVLQPGSAAASN